MPDGRRRSAVELVIFDCDGVLVDSEPLAVRVEAALISELGWPVTEADVIDRFVGRSDSYMLGEIEREIGRPLPDWQANYEARLHEVFRRELTPVSGVNAALAGIDVRTCVASSGTHAKVRLTLGLTGLLDHFDGRIFSVTDVEHGKPAPDLFLHAADRMRTAPDHCVVVEDSPSGVEAARAAGMRVLAYAGGITSADRLKGPNTIVFTDMTEVPSLLHHLDQTAAAADQLQT